MPVKTKTKIKSKAKRVVERSLPRVAKKVVRKRASRPRPVVIRQPASIEQSEKIFGVDAKRSREIRRLVDQVVA